MSEVASAAECSMGAIYSHFSSKEDLLLGCTAVMMRDRQAKLQTILKGITDPLDEFLTILFLLWHEDNNNSHEYDLRQLAWNPSIWQRASKQRNNDLTDVCNNTGDIMGVCCRRILTEYLQLTPTAELIDEFKVSLGGLSVGIYQFKESGVNISDALSTSSRSLDLHIACLARVLMGWGFPRDGLEERLLKLNHQTVALLSE